MSHGLVFLHKISQASTFDQVRLLKKNLIDTHFFLTRAMGEEPYDYVYRADAFDDWTNKLPLRFVDDNDGPNAAWTWSNADLVELFSFESSIEDLRKRGYATAAQAGERAAFVPLLRSFVFSYLVIVCFLSTTGTRIERKKERKKERKEREEKSLFSRPSKNTSTSTRPTD